jgi:carbon storage regulator CsrA
MLVLSRKLHESVILRLQTDDGVEKEVVIKVIDIGTRKVRIGFETDKDVTILREELVTGEKAGKKVEPQVVAAES